MLVLQVRSAFGSRCCCAPTCWPGVAHEHVRILTEVRGYSLLADDGRPDKSMASDHLPVLLELNF